MEKEIHTAGKTAVPISEGLRMVRTTFSCLNYSFGKGKDQSLFIN